MWAYANVCDIFCSSESPTPLTDIFKTTEDKGTANLTEDINLDNLPWIIKSLLALARLLPEHKEWFERKAWQLQDAADPEANIIIKELDHFKIHSAGVGALFLYGTEQVISGCHQGMLKICTLSGTRLASQNIGAGIISFEISWDKKYLLMGTTKGLAYMDMEEGHVVWAKGVEGWIRTARWLKPGVAIFSGDDPRIQIWKLLKEPDDKSLYSIAELGITPMFIAPLQDPCRSLLILDCTGQLQLRLISEDNLFLASSEPVWCRSEWEAESATVIAVDDLNKSCILGGDDGSLRVLECATGTEIWQRTVSSGVTAAAWTIAGWVTAHKDLSLRFWSVSGKPRGSYKTVHKSWIRKFFCEGALWISAGEDGVISVLEPSLI